MRPRLDVAKTSALLVAQMALASFAHADDRPAPPWQSTCQAMEAKTLDHLFKTPECKAEFNAVYAANDVAGTHAWMVGHRSCFKEWAHFSWIAYAANDAKMADLAWVQQLHLLRERGMAATSCAARSCLVSDVEQTLARGESPIGTESQTVTKEFLDAVEQNTAFKPKMDQALDGAAPLCLLHLNFECTGAMKKALNWMYPRSYRLSLDPPESMTYSMLALTREVFGDSTTQKYATRLAAEILRAVESGTYQEASFEALYPMMVRLFEGDYDRLWKFLIVYSTRGAAWATGYKMVGTDNQPIFAAMMVVSSAMGFLDTAWAPSGRAWSYAAAADDTCYQPKPYHYWMAGGFAYLLRKEGYSARTAKQVAKLLGAMYEVASDTMGRDPDRVFFAPTFDPDVNRARREVSHHALGAVAGIDYQTPEAPAFDATLDRLIQASKPLPDYTDEEMRAKIADKPTRWRLWTDLIGFYETFED